MIRLKFDNLKAVSTNAIYKGMGKNRSKSKAYKYLEQVVKFEMLKNRLRIKKFFSLYDNKTHYVKVKVFNELSNLIISKSKEKERVGCVSLTCLDVDNSFKALIDASFAQIGINDAEICALEGYKFQSDDKCNNIYLELEIINREQSWQTLKAYLSKDTKHLKT